MAALIKRRVRYVLVFPQGGGMYAVESLSRPGQFQSVDIVDRVCSCERFTIDPRDKGKSCRHLKDLDKLAKKGILTSFK